MIVYIHSTFNNIPVYETLASLWLITSWLSSQDCLARFTEIIVIGYTTNLAHKISDIEPRIIARLHQQTERCKQEMNKFSRVGVMKI